MNIAGIFISAVVVGIVGLIIGLLLGVAGEKFKVEVNEKELKIRDILPGNNCGGCGFAGCDALAKAIVDKTANISDCPVGGASVAAAIGKIMGISSKEKEKVIAFVKCAGTCEKANTKYNYYGLRDCQEASVVPGEGDKTCTYGCLGYGSCVKACAFGAIHIVDGIAVVDREKCVACGKCLTACPKNLIEFVPYKAKHLVQCNSKEKGKAVKEVCSVGCIGCMLCTKVCESEAIAVSNNLAHIDYSKCTNCGNCVQKCPVKIIK